MSALPTPESPPEAPSAPSASRRALRWALVPIAILALAAWRWSAGDEVDTRPTSTRAERVPVELSPIERGVLDEVRELPGTLEPSAQVVIAAETDGVVERVHVDLADEVAPGELLVELDAREQRQAERASRAALAVARARSRAAESSAALARRALHRTEALLARGIESERVLDDARAAAVVADAEEAVNQASVAQAQAAHGTARLDLEHTRVSGRWDAAAGPRHVAARAVDEGAHVSAGDPLLTVVDTDPLVVAVMVSPAEHARLAPGQPVELHSEGLSPFPGVVARVAPAFEESTRRARVEIEVANPEGALAPGRFVRALVRLARVEADAIVPERALVRRGEREVVFLYDAERGTARMVPVEVGLRAGGQVEIRGEGLTGAVITLGQQRLNDGSAVRPVEDAGDPSAARGRAARSAEGGTE